MSDPSDVEAYVADVDRTALVRVLSGKLGPLCSHDVDRHLHLYTWSSAKLLLNTTIKDGFTSVWIMGPSCWTSNAELARFLSRELGCRARCDPGDEYPGVSGYTGECLEISEGRERIVEWG